MIQKTCLQNFILNILGCKKYLNMIRVLQFTVMVKKLNFDKGKF